MSLVTTKELVTDAQTRHYAVPAINTSGGDYDIVCALCEACEEKGSPLILMAYTANLGYRGYDHFGMLGKYFAERVSVPVAVHLDHSETVEDCEKAIRSGFTSVMIDYSKKSIDDNIAITNKVLDIARPVGVSVEGEVGQLLRMDEPETANANLASVDDVKHFTDNCDVDMLAVGIGNKHGFYKGEPNIRTDLLESIRETTDVPLVLHGSTGIPEDMVRKCIQIGISKINFGTMIRVNYMDYAAEGFESFDHKKHPWRLKQYIMDRIKGDMDGIIDLVGSADKF